MGPYRIDKVFDKETVCFTTIDENQTPLFANGHRLWFYHKPILKDAFISWVAGDPDYQLEQEHGFSPVSKNL